MEINRPKCRSSYACKDSRTSVWRYREIPKQTRPQLLNKTHRKASWAYNKEHFIFQLWPWPWHNLHPSTINDCARYDKGQQPISSTPDKTRRDETRWDGRCFESGNNNSTLQHSPRILGVSLWSRVHVVTNPNEEVVEVVNLFCLTPLVVRRREREREGAPLTSVDWF